MICIDAIRAKMDIRLIDLAGRVKLVTVHQGPRLSVL